MFLLKIEYVKFIEDRLLGDENLDMEIVFFDDELEKSNGEFEIEEKIFLLNFNYKMGIFMCFFVLLLI